ncbi:MAG: MFS transporter [Gammaproteobacteria bacterium]|nr:MFS transporter [Gammaproteobacteria bacterium]
MILLFMDFLPLIIGNIFFPHYELIAQALAVWGVFWFGFIVRPLGELVFGYLGDKIGRKFAITLSIYVMAIPTTLMGLTPSFEQIGLFAPIILIVLRLLQGFCGHPPAYSIHRTFNCSCIYANGCKFTELHWHFFSENKIKNSWYPYNS